MKAYRFEPFDSLDDLRMRDEEAPRPQRGELLIRVHAVSLNSRDLAMLRGRNAYPFKTGLIPVSDAAGEVVEVGADVRAFKVGDRVMGNFHPVGSVDKCPRPSPTTITAASRMAGWWS